MTAESWAAVAAGFAFLTVLGGTVVAFLTYGSFQEAIKAGETLERAAGLLESSLTSLHEVLAAVSAARREEHLRTQVSHLRELERAFITRIQGAQEALATNGPSAKWVQGEVDLTIALSAFPDDELPVTHRALNQQANPASFLASRADITAEISAALKVALAELRAGYALPRRGGDA